MDASWCSAMQGNVPISSFAFFRKNTLEMEYNSSSDDTEDNSNTSCDQTEGEKRTHGRFT